MTITWLRTQYIQKVRGDISVLPPQRAYGTRCVRPHTDQGQQGSRSKQVQLKADLIWPVKYKQAG